MGIITPSADGQYTRTISSEHILRHFNATHDTRQDGAKIFRAELRACEPMRAFIEI